MATDLTTEILIQIRDELRTTRTDLSSRIDATNERLDATRIELSSRIDTTNERLDRVEKRQTESEIRISTAIVALAGAVNEVRDLLRDDRATREAVQKQETRISQMDQRLAAVERKVG